MVGVKISARETAIKRLDGARGPTYRTADHVTEGLCWKHLFSTTGASRQDCVNVPVAWQLAPTTESDQRAGKTEAHGFYDLALGGTHWPF